MNGRYLYHRSIRERIFIEGDLVLDSPTHLGNGSADGLVDMPLLLDPVDRRPLLTGASIAGALRNYLREYELGYQQEETPSAPSLVEQLFGCIAKEGEEEARLSWLMIDDAIAPRSHVSEIRDGVSINPVTRTARDKEKYDIELLPAGTEFKLRFELLIPSQEFGEKFIEALTIALLGLEKGEIGLGQRKRRGYGACHVKTWRVRRYTVTTLDGLIDWLKDAGNVQESKHILELLMAGQPIRLPDRRAQMHLTASFDIEDTLIIRSGSGRARSPDMIHLSNSNGDPVIPGTTLAGVLRHRAAQIINTIAPRSGDKMISELFGPRMQDHPDLQPRGSRLWVRECVIEKPQELVQTRVMIDRFTGGALPQHLFTEQPLTGGRIHLDCTIHMPSPAEVGLMLLLLKDLWTGELSLGGEGSIGRGRLHGVRAELNWNGETWHIQDQQGQLTITGTGSAEALETCVSAVSGL